MLAPRMHSEINSKDAPLTCQSSHRLTTFGANVHPQNIIFLGTNLKILRLTLIKSSSYVIAGNNFTTGH